MKLITRLAIACLVSLPATGAAAQNGWPANYEGVMLQGFYWDSYDDTKWTNLTAQADELSSYFSLIWVPNSAFCDNNVNMGYTPKYWFTNHNSSFGSERDLRNMINTFKAKGTGIIADMVINHRVGVSTWTDFPTERWNGQTWHIGPEGICNTDEVRNQSGQATPTGAADTGEDFAGARDLDHTNANVQNNCKNYAKCLLEDFGYAGFRLDMVKGYGGQYTKIYNEYSRPQFCVGEYWDGSYDAVANWIEATGKTSAAFDFPLKYQINKAFANNNMQELVWKALGMTDQPAGMIHYGYNRYAVTFVDNHDTGRDGSKFNGDVVAANAFILCSPGTPCIYLPHWKQYKSAIKTLIKVRNAVGVHNMSEVKVLKSSRDCYLAEVTGSKGKLAVRIGTSGDTPAGYSDADVKASGNMYRVWTKTNIQGGDDPVELPEELYVIGNLGENEWKTDQSVAMIRKNDSYVIRGIEITAPQADPTSNYGYFSFVTTRGASWDVVNQKDRWGASSEDEPIKDGQSLPLNLYPGNATASSACSWKIPAGIYDMEANFKTHMLSVSNYSGVENVTVSAPVEYYTLTGLRVDNPEKGIYIRHTGSRIDKVILR